jgi:Zn-dependent M32 family carboxypeptidase
MISKGQFKALKEWLSARIHKMGSLYNNGDELMVHATGSPLNPAVFTAYLWDKYKHIYSL